MKQNLWKTKTYFKKLDHRFLAESTEIESASSPYETAISEGKVKTNRMVSTKWTYHKERSFASNYLIFFENYVSVREPLIKSWFDVPTTQMPILVLFVSAGVLFDGAFSLWVPLMDASIIPQSYWNDFIT